MGKQVVIYSDEDAFECPVCKKETHSLKKFVFNLASFYLISFTIDTYTVVACPECMEKILEKLKKSYIWRANILYPMVVLAINCLIKKARKSGHSKNLFS